jgi:hypothetical protein
MPPKLKAKMACSVADAAVFLEKQSDIKADCEDLFKTHLGAASDVEWNHKDGPGMSASLRCEKARLKLVLSIEFDEETGRPRFPPPNTRLSDELVYLATKHMNNTLRGQRYSYDFDKKGDIAPDRMPSGPAPIVWAHGLPFFPVYKGYYILCGRDHALCIGWLIADMTKSIMKVSPHWAIGAVIAPKTAVRSEHLVDRQISLHQPWGAEKDLRFKGKSTSRDVVSADHHDCAVLPRLDGEAQVHPLWEVPGYNAQCGPKVPGTCPTLMRKDFFIKHEIDEKIDYIHLCRHYSNIYTIDAEDDEPDLKDTEMADEMADNSDQLLVAQPPEPKDKDIDTNGREEAIVQLKQENLGETEPQPIADTDGLDNLSMHVDQLFNKNNIIDHGIPTTSEKALVPTDVPERETEEGPGTAEQTFDDQMAVEQPEIHQTPDDLSSAVEGNTPESA